MSDRFDAVLTDWISEGPDRGPDEGLKRALAATRRIGQRPGWTFPRRWLPAPAADVAIHVPQFVGVGLLLVLSLLVLMALAIAIVGSRPPVRPILEQGASVVAFQDGPAIFVATVDGSARQKLSGDVEYARAPLFSPDGSRVAFLAPSSADALGGRLFVASLDGARPPVDVSRGMEVLAADVPSLTWSPDGTQIAFAARDGATAQIFLAASDGSLLTPLTSETGDADLPSWSPDGAWIAYRLTDPDGMRRYLRKVRPDGSEAQSVTTTVAADSSLSKLRWSPISDAVSYALNVGFGTDTKAIIDLGFGHIGELWANGLGGYVDAGIPWSPSGQFLAFISATDGVIVAQNDPTAPYDGELRMLGNVADCWVEWSPDGTTLYGGSPDGCGGVVVIPIDEPGAAVALPTTTSGTASWQPQKP